MLILFIMEVDGLCENNSLMTLIILSLKGRDILLQGTMKAIWKANMEKTGELPSSILISTVLN